MGACTQLVQEAKPVANNSHLLGINFLPVQFSDQGSVVGRDASSHHSVLWDQADTSGCNINPTFRCFELSL